MAEERERKAAEMEEARRAALAKLADAEREKREQADREAARLASLRRQQELEAESAQKAEILARSIYPVDYKRRQHYYMEVDMKNYESSQKMLKAPGRPGEPQKPQPTEAPKDEPKS